MLLFSVARLPVPREASCCLEPDLQDLHDLQEEELFALTRLWGYQRISLQVRRTCMSIEKRTCHRFQGPLGP